MFLSEFQTLLRSVNELFDETEGRAGGGCSDEGGSGQTVALTAALCDAFRASAGSERSLVTLTEL